MLGMYDRQALLLSLDGKRLIGVLIDTRIFRRGIVHVRDERRPE